MVIPRFGVLSNEADESRQKQLSRFRSSWELEIAASDMKSCRSLRNFHWIKTKAGSASFRNDERLQLSQPLETMITESACTVTKANNSGFTRQRLVQRMRQQYFQGRCSCI